jgi:hypothetical protein
MSKTVLLSILFIALAVAGCETEPERSVGQQSESPLYVVEQRLRSARYGRWKKVRPPLMTEDGLVVWRLVVHEFPPTSETATAAWCIYVGELMQRHLPGHRWLAVMAQKDSILRKCEDGDWRSIWHPFLNPNALRTK